MTRGVFVGLLDGTFSTLPRTWSTSLLLGGLLFIPPALLFGWACGLLFAVLARTLERAGEEPGPVLIAMGLAYLWLLPVVAGLRVHAPVRPDRGLRLFPGGDADHVLLHDPPVHAGMAGLGRRLGILQYIQSLLGGFVTPVFLTLLFLHLRRGPEPAVAPAAAESITRHV